MQNVFLAVITVRANAVRGEPDMVVLEINLITTDGTAIHAKQLDRTNILSGAYI
jgi:hypothetical protein